MADKLELTWVGKSEDIKLEPRILLEDKEKSYGDCNTDNLLIHGDNLLALKALETKYAGKIKCIYIDPPYNTGSAFEHYDDNLEHSIWLSLMHQRMKLLKKLLAEDGLIFVQIDDNEQAYFTVMMDEIFGRKNRVNTICVKMSEATGVKMTHATKRLPKLKEYIIVYKKNDIEINQVKIPKDKWDSEYKILLTNIEKEDVIKVKNVMNNENSTDEEIKEIDDILKDVESINIEEYFKKNKINDKNEKEKFKYDNAWRILRDVATTGNAKVLADKKRKTCQGNYFLIKTVQNKIYLIKNNYNMETEQPRIKMLFAEDYLMINPCDLWLDIATTGLEAEGNIQFKNSKKPEKLIKRCIELSTKEGDYVLDSFLGSGTTCAVAHKMNRRWIGIELGDHCYTLSKARLDNVIDGEQSGVSKIVNWQGGGGYKFYELAPTLVKQDEFGVDVVNNEYNAEMLASAVALHEGFEYKPSNEIFWKQAQSTEKSFLYTTTNHITEQYLEQIIKELNDDEYLLIACKSFDRGIERLYKNITIKKIPSMLLGKCEFGKDDYSLNIINPPEYEEEEDNE